MSRIAEKRNSLLMNSTGGQNKEITKGNISFIIPNEQPNQNEVTVEIDIKDVRFGSNSISLPEITAIVNGSKVVSIVPFKEPLHYHFKRVEDEMVFKFAVTSAGDLLGFIFLEIPQKFKSMKSFRLDDWFPVKHLPTEENDKLIKENFVARITLDYKGMRKLEPNRPPALKIPKAKLLEEMAVGLKQKVDDINQELDAFDDEGFKHLTIFHKKLMKKRINHGSKGQDPNKPAKVQQLDNKFVDQQRDVFYKSKTALGGTMEVKVQALAPGQFYDKAVNFARIGKEGNADCNRCENLTKELKFSHNELTQAHQKTADLEQGSLVVDNDQLRRELEKMQVELNKDRKEIQIKLKDASSLGDQETHKIRKYYDGESNKVRNAQNEAKTVMQDLRKQLENIERRENQVPVQMDQLQQFENEVFEKEQKIIDTNSQLANDHLDIEDKESEMVEIKNRMMLERQRVCEETNQLQFLKGDSELRSKQMATLESFLGEEKEAFRDYVDKRDDETEQIRLEIADQRNQHKLERQDFERTRDEYDRKNKELLENINKQKAEVNRLSREQKEHELHLVEFGDDKKLIEQERDSALLDINNECANIEDKTRLFNEQKAEFETFNQKLGDYENYLQQHNRLQQEQNSRFLIQQRQFFKKLNDTNFDLKELKNLGGEIGTNLNIIDEKFEETQKQERNLAKNRLLLKKNIDLYCSNQPKERDLERRTSIVSAAGASPTGSNTAENKIQIQQKAFRLVEKIFSEAVLSNFKQHTEQKEELVRNLKGSADKLQNKLGEMHQAIKLNKLKYYTSKDKNQAKVKIISNPFASNNLNDSDIAQEEHHAERNHEVDESDGQGHERMLDLQENMEDVVDSTIHLVNEWSEGKQSAKSRDRIQYLIETRKCLQNVFAIIKLLSVKNKHENSAADLNDNYDNFNLLKLKVDLESKLKELVEFVVQIKQNNDFFNPNLDGEIFEE